MIQSLVGGVIAAEYYRILVIDLTFHLFAPKTQSAGGIIAAECWHTHLRAHAHLHWDMRTHMRTCTCLYARMCMRMHAPNRYILGLLEPGTHSWRC